MKVTDLQVGRRYYQEGTSLGPWEFIKQIPSIGGGKSAWDFQFECRCKPDCTAYNRVTLEELVYWKPEQILGASL